MTTLSVQRYGSLEKTRSEYLAKIDVFVEDFRKQYVAPIAGQGLICSLLAQDAKAYKTAGYPTPVDSTAYPWVAGLASGVQASAKTVTDVYLQKYFAWEQAIAPVEMLALAAKYRLRKAATAREMHDIFQTAKTNVQVLLTAAGTIEPLD